MEEKPSYIPKEMVCILCKNIEMTTEFMPTRNPNYGGSMTGSQYASPQQIVLSGKYPFSMGQMRHLLLYRHRNGLQVAVRKIGKRLVLRLDLFDSWIDSQGKEEGRL